MLDNTQHAQRLLERWLGILYEHSAEEQALDEAVILCLLFVAEVGVVLFQGGHRILVQYIRGISPRPAQFIVLVDVHPVHNMPRLDLVKVRERTVLLEPVDMFDWCKPEIFELALGLLGVLAAVLLPNQVSRYVVLLVAVPILVAGYNERLHVFREVSWEVQIRIQ